MALKNRLLATVAVPFLAIASYALPAQAMAVRPSLTVPIQTPVLDIAMSVAEARANLAAARQALADAKANGGDVRAAKAAVAEARAALEAAQSAAGARKQNNDNGASDDQNQGNKKRKKNAQADDGNGNNSRVIEVPQDRQSSQDEVIPKKNKKKNQQAPADDSGVAPADKGQMVMPSNDNGGQNDDATIKRKKNKKDKQEVTAPGDDNVIQDDTLPAKKNKKHKQNQTTDDNGAVVDPSRDNANSSIEVIDTQKDKKKRDKQRQQDLQDQQKADDQGNKTKKDDAASKDPVRIKERRKIADDPSKSSDTIELPVNNGAAVLDSDKDADKSADSNLRQKRKKQREAASPARVPHSDRDAQAGFKGDKDKPIKIKPVLELKGERLTGFKGYDRPDGRQVGKDGDIRVEFNLDGRAVIRSDDRIRLGRNGQTQYEQLSGGRIREIVIRPNGDKIVTVRNRYGEIIRRSRINNRQKEIVIFYMPELMDGRDRLYLRDPGDELPPMRLTVPVRDYIADVSSEPDRDYEEFLAQPPVEQVERVYSVDEVKNSARLRDKVRRIDLDTITFDTGSASISMDQSKSLKKVANAINGLLEKDSGETFIIEGHTDAVGSDDTNLVLSDERAESVANVLTDVFDIPAENLVTQGYGERFLKVKTDGPELLNRRVTIRRITPLVRPVAANE